MAAGKPQAIILAGGKGERFWPLSRTDRPKQLLNVLGGVTLLKATFERLKFVFGPENIWVVSLARYGNAIRVQLPEIPSDQIILEPVGRNTAAPIALCAHLIQKKNGPTSAAVFPSDHIITGREKFTQAVESSLKALEKIEAIVTIGVKPRSPETAYGYIKRGRKLPGLNGIPLYKGEAFEEKPDDRTARKYVRSSRYFWNAGIFIFDTGTILAEYSKQFPKLVPLLESVPFPPDAESLRQLYEAFPFISVDYAIMEKAVNIAVYPADFVWSDLGSWGALEAFFEPDQDRVAAKGRVVSVGSRNCFVFNSSRVVALVGVENLHVVETDDAILICRKDRDQDIKQIVEKLNQKGWKEVT